MIKMKNTVFVDRAIDIAKNYKTLYVMGGIGAPLTDERKKFYCANYAYNKKAARTAMIKAASADTFSFDCNGLIESILWGWCGDKTKTYGGAKYASNGVPDDGADGMIQKCSGVKTDDWATMIPGEVVWCKGHIGIYIGNGLAVEASPAWKNQVQITAVKNIGTKPGYNARTWTKHGKLPYVDYPSETVSSTTSTTDSAAVKKIAGAKNRNASAKNGVRFKVTASVLNVRSSASSENNSNRIGSAKRGELVTWYGYYTGAFYLVVLPNNSTGYVHKNYLKRV